jgi:hypothetical protein
VSGPSSQNQIRCRYDKVQRLPPLNGGAAEGDWGRRDTVPASPWVMRDLPMPLSPITDLQRSLRTLEALPDKNEMDLADLAHVRQMIADRRKRPLPGDPE